MENQWRSQGMLKLVAYRGGPPGGHRVGAQASYGRCFVGVAKLEQWPVTLDQLIWAAHTHGAPGRSLLSHETAFAHLKYAAFWPTRSPRTAARGRLGAAVRARPRRLPLFDPSSIPAHLVVDSNGRSFLFKALAHPDERIARAAAHAMQRIMHHHMALPCRPSGDAGCLAACSRRMAVRVTTLSHFVQLISVWIEELRTMDPFKLTSAAMLERSNPTWPSRERGPNRHATRTPRCDCPHSTLYRARTLGQALADSYGGDEAHHGRDAAAGACSAARGRA